MLEPTKTETKQELVTRLARLESLNDFLSSEIGSVDTLLKEVGFSEGLASMKEVAEDMVGKN